MKRLIRYLFSFPHSHLPSREGQWNNLLSTTSTMTGEQTSLQCHHLVSLNRIYFRFEDPSLARKYSADSMAFSIFDFDETSSSFSVPTNVMDRLRRLLTTVMAFECNDASDRKIIPELISTFTFRSKYGDSLYDASSVQEAIVEALKFGESGLTVLIESASSSSSSSGTSLPENMVYCGGRSTFVEPNEIVIPTPKSLLMMVHSSTKNATIEPTPSLIVSSFPQGFQPLHEEAEEREGNGVRYSEMNHFSLNHHCGDVRDGQLPYVLSQSSTLGGDVTGADMVGGHKMVSVLSSSALSASSGTFLLPAFFEGLPTTTSLVGSPHRRTFSPLLIDESLLMLGHESDMVCILESVLNIVK